MSLLQPFDVILGKPRCLGSRKLVKRASVPGQGSRVHHQLLGRRRRSRNRERGAGNCHWIPGWPGQSLGRPCQGQTRGLHGAEAHRQRVDNEGNLSFIQVGFEPGSFLTSIQNKGKCSRASYDQEVTGLRLAESRFLSYL